MGEIPPEQKTQPDVVLEANPMQEPMLATAELRQMDRCSHSVALIEVTCYRRGKRASTETGTGWLIAPGLVLTCWHVVATLTQVNDPPPAADDLKLQIEHMLLSFNHIEIGAGGIQYKVKSLEYPLNETNSQDFAVLRLEDRSDRSYQQFGYLPIELDTPFTQQTRLSIIQHPLGQTQQIPTTPGHFVNHSSQTAGRIFYTTPTDRGTSGSPVLNCYNWRAVALHNGENREVQLREGTRIKYILSELQDKKPDLYNEIMEAQRDLDNALSPIHLTHPLNLYVRSSKVTFQASFPSADSAKQEEVSPEETHAIADSNKNLVSVSPVQNMSNQPLSRQVKQISQETVLKEYRQKIAKYRSEIRHIRKKLRTKTTLYPDECSQLLANIQPLHKPIDEMERFTTQKLSKSYPGRLELTASLHHLQALLNELSERMATFCTHCQDNGQEERKEIIQKVDELNKALSLERSGKRFSLWLHR